MSPETTCVANLHNDLLWGCMEYMKSVWKKSSSISSRIAHEIFSLPLKEVVRRSVLRYFIVRMVVFLDGDVLGDFAQSHFSGYSSQEVVASFSRDVHFARYLPYMLQFMFGMENVCMHEPEGNTPFYRVVVEGTTIHLVIMENGAKYNPDQTSLPATLGRLLVYNRRSGFHFCTHVADFQIQYSVEEVIESLRKGRDIWNILPLDRLRLLSQECIEYYYDHIVKESKWICKRFSMTPIEPHLAAIILLLPHSEA